MLEILPIQMNTSVSKGPVICSACSKNLQKSFEFKSTCLSQDIYLKTFLMGVTEVANLQDIIMNKNICRDIIKKEEENICRFCLKYYSMDYLTSLSNSEDLFLKDILERCCSEIDLTISIDPLACNSCIESLQHQFNFIAQCSDSEQLIINYMSFENIPSNQEIKLENVYEYTARTKSEFKSSIYFIKQEEESEPDDEFFEDIGSGPCKVENAIHMKTEGTYKGCNFSPRLKPRSKAPCNFPCSHCPYKTHRRDSLISHLLVHKNSDNIKTHKCDICNFESKWRTSLTSHMLRHKKLTDLTMYKCNDCTYQSKYKKHLRRHMKTHSNKTIYSCEFCKCRSKYREYIDNHRCKHNQMKQEVKIEPEEIKVEEEGNREKFPIDCSSFTKVIEPSKHCWWYKCHYCPYETKKIHHMKEHSVKHLKKDEMDLHECGLCKFKTKYRASLNHHKRQIHQRKDMVV
ncbi:uncharacterized protein [Leptinotarsa decemlineata]|uniref:uncharacterized protein n=1 Tax=Leptinotarsa decemlineata TaxID=7539 RepID=UPI003D30B7F8